MNEKTLDPKRAYLMHLIERSNGKWSLSNLSQKLGRNDAYLHQYIHKGSPRDLKEGDRIKLAKLLKVTPRSLQTGSNDIDVREDIDSPDTITVPTVDVRFGAGGGQLASDDRVTGYWAFTPEYLRELRIDPTQLVIAEVIGDSMEPLLSAGDRVGIDQRDVNPANPGVFAMHDSNALVVKRVEKVPVSDPVRLVLSSDNPNHGSYDVLADDCSIIGRVVWVAKRL